MRRITVLLSIAFFALASQAALADVISERKAGFRGNAAALKQMKTAIAAADTKAVASAANAIADWSARMLDYFPEGSGEGDTTARAEIWRDFDDFTRHAVEAENAALEMAALATAGQQERLKDGFRKLGGTCKACHSKYKH